ncbi:hypothetical protein [Agrobacterium radiobacter]|uniref:hypothetical protein n=1 Tax=Agrobacterium radiobacter TaxID=362 RepID=UPI000760D37F|nr:MULTISPECIES: hypothetical protein [Agrobacterium tumefaciens complex]KAB0459931.1 hypothetical protein F7R04_13650 [Agrobacterium tumefaciens]KWT76936.1 hypothetical protein ASH09_11295 [Agrobacterium radiobacter]NIB11287.1 hypothetical protein [Agrobacterium radiobacter]OOO38407.1 hypothetical protein BS628_09755 [Agrobacterium radiobacter]
MTYTKGETRALDVIRAQIRENRRCELSYIEVAQLAGVGKSTARTAVLKAEKEGDLLVRRRPGDGLSNVLRLPQVAKLAT